MSEIKIFKQLDSDLEPTVLNVEQSIGDMVDRQLGVSPLFIWIKWTQKDT